jgi:L-ascorbate metabolism protein UlaG (beta-lactamase superfamily)
MLKVGACPCVWSKQVFKPKWLILNGWQGCSTVSLETATPKKGEIAFVWFNGYSGVTVKTPTKTLVLDPASVDPDVFKTVDAVLITHEHYDHLDEGVVQKVHERTHCMVLADSTSAKRLKDFVSGDKLFEMRVGKELKLGNASVRAEAYKHPAATPVSYLITTEDGVRVYHTGDSLPHPDMKQVAGHGPPDIVFCTVGMPAPGASPQSGLEIVRLVRPKAAVPYHAPYVDRKKFSELVAKEAPKVKCMVVEQSEIAKYP